ncbi:MAG: HAMP domain-containing sensor histidine kinase [Bacilli bacterium]
MNIIEGLWLEVIYIIFPLLCYLFYVAYMRNVNELENKLILDLALFTSLFLSIKYGYEYTNRSWMVLFNIPLLIAYYKERQSGAVILSIFMGLYDVFILEWYPLLIIMVYSLYLIIYLWLKKKNYPFIYLLNLYTVVKGVSLLFYVDNLMNCNFISMGNILVIMLTFYLLTYIIISIINQCENIINLNINIKQLEKEKQLKDSLFKITHEIKNPIAVCKGYLDMFDVNDKRQVEKYIPIIHQEIDRTLMLLTDFLDFTKIKIEKDILDIHLLMDDVCASALSLFKTRRIRTSIKIPNQDLYFLGDYNRLKQVFINIIKNAIEAIPNNKHGVLKISVEHDDKWISIFIKDNGNGIDQEILSRIDEAFYTTKKKGTGLGLFLAKEIIGAHGGLILFESKINVGTTVIIKLPRNY